VKPQLIIWDPRYFPSSLPAYSLWQTRHAPTIHQIQKPKFFGTNSNETKISFIFILRHTIQTSFWIRLCPSLYICLLWLLFLMVTSSFFPFLRIVCACLWTKQKTKRQFVLDTVQTDFTFQKALKRLTSHIRSSLVCIAAATNCNTGCTLRHNAIHCNFTTQYDTVTEYLPHGPQIKCLIFNALFLVLNVSAIPILSLMYAGIGNIQVFVCFKCVHNPDVKCFRLNANILVLILIKINSLEFSSLVQNYINSNLMATAIKSMPI